MKFINKSTGVIYNTDNEFVISQLKKDNRLEEFVDKKVEKKETKKVVKKK